MNEMLREMVIRPNNKRDEITDYIATLDFNELSLEELERWFYLSYDDGILQAIKTKCPLTYFEIKTRENL